MSKKPIFLAHNHHSGEAPEAPAKTSALYESYFESKHGDQWIFRYDRDTREIAVCSGDCGWRSGFQPIRLPLQLLLDVDIDSLTMQMLLAGKVAVARPLVATKGLDVLLTILLDENGQGLNLNRGESMWLDACIAASGAEIPQKDVEWLRDHVARMPVMTRTPIREDGKGDELEPK